MSKGTVRYGGKEEIRSDVKLEEMHGKVKICLEVGWRKQLEQRW